MNVREQGVGDLPDQATADGMQRTSADDLVTDVAMLRTLYAQPSERAQLKQMARLDVHCRRYIELSPFVVLASADAQGRQDASPRGGDPGFVQVVDDARLLIPDSPGNNRLDTLQNVIETGRVGLLFLLPGMDETLRINGRASLSRADWALERCTTERRRPKLVIDVQVEDVYLHCAKALMRSALWDPQRQVERSVLPTMNQMIRDQIGGNGPVESQQAMVERYRADL